MTRVMVEFPIEEAEGILKRLAPPAAECDAAEVGRQRLERALAVEREASGAAEAEAE